mgnify:CR=1 FL=1
MERLTLGPITMSRLVYGMWRIGDDADTSPKHVQAKIEACLAALDGSHRQSLALAYYQGLSHSEVAAQMGAPLGSVKAWIRRGLERLKSCLSAQGVGA